VLTSLRESLWRRFRSSTAGGSVVDDFEPLTESTLKRQLSAPFPCLCGLTDTGVSRRNNEDAFFLSSDGNLWIVADGMGGQAAGEIASTLTIEAIACVVQERHASSDPGESLVDGLHEARRRVMDYTTQNEECKGMGSAVAAVYLDHDHLHICHAGDVRCYVHRQDLLERVTEDHSIVEQLVRADVLTPDQARFHPDRSKLAQAVGLAKHFKPTLSSRVLASGDRVLLCSDGLWDLLSDDEIGSVLSSKGSMRQLATVLADRALAAGGDDNVTVVLYEHGVRPSDV
jgi:serine/threonine protein phosphatase PrpC